MKYVSLITGSDLRMVMGVNYYIKSFIGCNTFFKNIKVNRVYSGSQKVKIDEGECIPIGTDIGTAEYRFRRGIRTFLRKLLTDKFFAFALFRYEFNLRMNSKRALSFFVSDNAPCDFILFQEYGVAEYFFKHRKNNPKFNDVKTFLVVHSEGDTRKSSLAHYGKRVNNYIQRIQDKRRDYVYTKIDKVIYISQRAYDNSIITDEKRSFVYNGVPQINYSFTDVNNQIKQFTCVGSIARIKGEEKILEAMSLMKAEYLKKMHMTFVGGGQLLGETIELSKKLGLENYVSFLGTRNDVPAILQGMDVFIMPSLTEGLSMSAIEAMRAGLFLVLTDTGGNKELCDDGCGVICTREPENIRIIMEEIIDGSTISRAQKEHSHNRFVRLFSTESMAKGYEDVLLSI